jgi:hypothetical protein
MRKILLLVPMIFALGACTHGNCRAQKKDTDKSTVAGGSAAATAEGASTPGATTEAAVVSSSTERVKVYKPDGSLQCGQGKAVPLAEMQKQLKNIKVYSSANKNDGMMRIQVCGSPTGNANIYEIDRKDLEAALKTGFKEWTFE